MATLKTIRKRISSVKNTQQITKAMKMVSAAKLRRAQEAAVQARPYAEKMTELLKNVSARVSSEVHPLLTSREEKKVQLVLFTSDRGLCGGYNTNMIRAAEAFIRQHGEDRRLFPLGTKRDYDGTQVPCAGWEEKMPEPSRDLLMQMVQRVLDSQGETREDIREIKTRIGRLESEVASMHGFLAGQSIRLDRFSERLERVDRRLEIADS